VAAPCKIVDTSTKLPLAFVFKGVLSQSIVEELSVKTTHYAAQQRPAGKQPDKRKEPGKESKK